MKSFLIVYIFLITIVLQAQGSISGNFAPPKDFKWLIAYELTPGGERYVADTTIKDGSFAIQMPVTAQAGMYRLVYAVPQDEFYIDIIYDKKEHVKFNFNIQEGLTITNSEENKWFHEYFTKIDAAQEKLMEFYENDGSAGKQYTSLIQELKDIQKHYEEDHVNSIAHQFIKSNRSYLPKDYQTLEEFLNHKKQHHFDNVDLNNPILQGSNFLTDKISNYVFSALPTGIKTKEQLALEVNKNIKTVSEKLKTTPAGFQMRTFYQLWKIAGVNTMPSVEDYIFDNHLKKLALANGNQKLVNDIESAARLRIGAKSPEIVWESNGKKHSLSSMENADCYLIIFWSSTCSHCLKEVPALHKELKNFKNVKVLAIGLEDEKQNWEKVSATLPNFTHGISLKKWNSEYVPIFNIHKTPTYFILDSEKRFIAKPDSDKEVVEFLEN
ncbi:TlpA family protein disulfide reductase [Maribacter sp. X9]|uniref:TlpA family protein disulfide reductase n=1 Tax=Maribacter sp. X9 TaxID=3402159 RepID=UPI003AF3A82A